MKKFSIKKICFLDRGEQQSTIDKDCYNRYFLVDIIYDDDGYISNLPCKLKFFAVKNRETGKLSFNQADIIRDRLEKIYLNFENDIYTAFKKQMNQYYEKCYKSKISFNNDLDFLQSFIASKNYDNFKENSFFGYDDFQAHIKYRIKQLNDKKKG